MNQKEGTGEDLARRLEAQFGQPEPVDWRSKYTPEEVEAYAGELADLEHQLDVQHPGWRKREPFDKLRPEKLKWVKLRLKRRALILEGRGAWGVVAATTSGGVMAVPVKPSTRLTAAYRPLVSVPLLCQALGLDRETVEAGIEAMPPACRDVRAWLRTFVSGREVEPAEAPSFPPSPAPLAALPGGDA